MSTVTTKQAEAVVAELQRVFNPVLTGENADLGHYDGRFYPAPHIMVDEGHTMVTWEEGPSDFAFNLDGSPSEEDYALFAQASAEFGKSIKPGRRPAFKCPKGVEVDVYASYALSVYRVSR